MKSCILLCTSDALFFVSTPFMDNKRDDMYGISLILYDRYIEFVSTNKVVFLTAILFDDAILLGAENDTTLYTTDSNSVFSLPFCVVNRTVSIFFKMDMWFFFHYCPKTSLIILGFIIIISLFQIFFLYLYKNSL